MAKVPAAGYDESDSINSMDGTGLPLAPSPPRLCRVLQFTTITDRILSVLVVPTLAEN